MDHIDNDIKILKSKLEDTFEVYEKFTDFSYTSIEKSKKEAKMLNQSAWCINYLSHVQGRQRNLAMYERTREDLISSRKVHNQNKLQCYSDLLNQFKIIGII